MSWSELGSELGVSWSEPSERNVILGFRVPTTIGLRKLPAGSPCSQLAPLALRASLGPWSKLGVSRSEPNIILGPWVTETFLEPQEVPSLLPLLPACSSYSQLTPLAPRESLCPWSLWGSRGYGQGGSKLKLAPLPPSSLPSLQLTPSLLPALSSLPACSQLSPASQLAPACSSSLPPLSSLPACSSLLPALSSLPAYSSLLPLLKLTPSLLPALSSLPAHSSLLPTPSLLQLAPARSQLPARSSSLQLTPSSLPAHSQLTPAHSQLSAHSSLLPACSSLLPMAMYVLGSPPPVGCKGLWGKVGASWSELGSELEQTGEQAGANWGASWSELE